MTDLQTPLTEVEKAELSEACQRVLGPEGMMLLRRLMFEVGVLKEQPPRQPQDSNLEHPQIRAMTLNEVRRQFDRDGDREAYRRSMNLLGYRADADQAGSQGSSESGTGPFKLCPDCGYCDWCQEAQCCRERALRA